MIGSRATKNALGVILLVSLLIGGATQAGILTDSLLEAAVFIVFLAATSVRPGNYGQAVRWALFFLCAVVLIQFVPVPDGLVSALRPVLPGAAVLDPAQGVPEWTFVSTDVGRSLTAAVFFLAALAFFTMLGSLSRAELRGLLPFVLSGAACNLVAAAIQYSAAKVVAVGGLLPYTLHAGFFVNENHFSALIFMTIPFVVLVAVQRKARVLPVLLMAIILVVQFAVGSRAGVTFAVAVTAVSILVASRPSGRQIALVLFLLVVVALLYFVHNDTFFQPDENPQFGRIDFARTTLEGISRSFVLGYGYGSFEFAYSMFEKTGNIFREYVNHAHNDYLEIVFDGGVTALAALGVYFVLLMRQVRHAWREPMARAAFVSLALVLIHSLVDYPLRTMGLALFFAYLNALVFHEEGDGAEGPATLALHDPVTIYDLHGSRMIVVEPVLTPPRPLA